MALFKSSKNQSASATTTPRSSMNEQRPVQVIKMTQDQALEMLHKKAMPNASAGPFILPTSVPWLITGNAFNCPI
ncbi:hypothetical protein BGZ58_008247 [Dissophora ornata]|nr:hypothetical protein BGZ58_008247 [Dissophora ornata]